MEYMLTKLLFGMFVDSEDRLSCGRINKNKKTIILDSLEKMKSNAYCLLEELQGFNLQKEIKTAEKYF